MARLVFAGGGLAFLVGCGGAPAAPPAPPPKACEALSPLLAITATARTNALATGEGRPVQLRIYQLKSEARLRSASFEDIWQNDAKVLEGEFVSSEQHTVFPGEKKNISIAIRPEAVYLAVVALFREPQGKDWFLTYEVAPPPKEPPCPKEAKPIPVWLDRMQIQDGAGRDAEGDDPSAATSSGN